MNKLILSNLYHPLYKKLSSLDNFIDLEEYKGQQADLLFDLTACDSNTKATIFKQFHGSVISDLSLNNGDKLMQDFPNLVGAIATVVPSPRSCCEVYLSDQSYNEELEKLLTQVGLTPVATSSAGIGFIFPRVIAQIINEAWFALEDQLASADAIDTAMLYGVNYPKGPIAWGQAAGHRNIITLLDELYRSTNDPRYRVSKKLEESIL